MSIFKSKYEKNLDEIINRLEMNMSNNYKDNAQDNLRELEECLNSFKESGKMKPAAIGKYENIIADYKENMKGFTHKDQKPYWH